MQKTSFQVLKMDCPSEEQIIRMRLADFAGIESLQFDIANRALSIFHTGDVAPISQALKDLDLGASFVATIEADGNFSADTASKERRTLWQILAVNFSFFVIEFTTGFISNSMGLVADSLDMLADSLVYAISLLAVGATLTKKKKVARVAGYFQLGLAILGFVEVLRRFLGVEERPEFWTMIVVSGLALIANAFCLYLLQKSRSNDAHMQASMIFTSNDIVINLGVIAAAICVFLLDSNKPDLLIGAIVFIIVVRGANQILKLGK